MITGAAIMIVEILGAKMLAPYVGTSHFVWTAQIAVALIGLASGYALGGWLADRSPRLTWIYGAILGAAVWLCGTVLVCEPVAYACLRFKVAAGSLLAALILYFTPLALLAMVGPFFVRVVAPSLTAVGTTVGRLTALSTLGSVLGTLLIGYVLIPLLPNSVTMLVTAGLLGAVTAAYFLLWERKQAAPVIVSLLLAGFGGWIGTLRPVLAQPAGWNELYRANSNFGLLQVVEDVRGQQRFYLNDLLTQNTYDPAAGRSQSLFTHMLYGLAHAYTPQLRDALCIGLGVGVVPMQLAREGIQVDAVEINPDVVPLAQEFFGFEPERLNLTIGDGRHFVGTVGKQYDTIILDAFLGESPPSHLMTREALGAMRRCLRPGGTLVMNTFGDFTPGRDFFLASLLLTLETQFQSVKVHDGATGNVFFVAADQPELRLLRTPSLESVPIELQDQVRYTFDNLREPQRWRGRVLTDDYNPVDVRDAVNREALRRRLALHSRPS